VLVVIQISERTVTTAQVDVISATVHNIAAVTGHSTLTFGEVAAPSGLVWCVCHEYCRMRHATSML
jgi:hypothetical protein